MHHCFFGAFLLPAWLLIGCMRFKFQFLCFVSINGDRFDLHVVCALSLVWWHYLPMITWSRRYCWTPVSRFAFLGELEVGDMLSSGEYR